ncbi:MAG: beta-lactamase family protein [Acidobacteriia bacterium]|nr:beta-lactamase family protein [Terriglobia bacterium]
MSASVRAWRMWAGIVCTVILLVPGMTFAQSQTSPTAVELPSTPAGKLMAAWLEALNSGDRDKMLKFQTAHLPAASDDRREQRLNRMFGLRQQTGGFTVEKIENSSANSITGVVKEKNSENRASFTLETEGDDRIANMGLQLIGPPPSAAQGPDSQRPPEPAPAKKPVPELIKDVDSQLTKLTAEDKFSGAVLIAKDGKVQWQKAYGMANRESKTPNTLDTRFRLGSMNKMFTSVAIAQLVQQGKLKYSDALAHVLPDYPNKEVAAKITVDQLLTHTSGLGDFFGPEFDQKKDSLRDLKDYLPLFANKPLKFEPGKGWAYSNAGFLVLGLIVEKLSGQNYYDYVQKHIYDAAGMKNSGSPPATEKVANLAVGYTRQGDGDGDDDPKAPLKPNTAGLPWRASSAGGGDSTLGDLLKFHQALQGNKLLSPELTREVTTGKVHPPMFPPGRKYAYGFGDFMVGGHRVVGHNGGAPGMNAQLDMHWDTGYTVVVLENMDPPGASDMAKYISDRLP